MLGREAPAGKWEIPCRDGSGMAAALTLFYFDVCCPCFLITATVEVCPSTLPPGTAICLFSAGISNLLQMYQYTGGECLYTAHGGKLQEKGCLDRTALHTGKM